MLIFYLGLICTVIVGCINAIIRIVQKQKPVLWGYLSLFLIIIGGFCSHLIFSNNIAKSKITEKQFADTRERFDAIQRCSHEAELGYYGGRLIYGPGISTNDPLYNALVGSYDDKGKFYCGEEHEDKYKNIILQFPRFPFTYYALALCKQQRNDPDWKGYALDAVEIFNCTTQIGGHNSEHDVALEQLNALLNQ